MEQSASDRDTRVIALFEKTIASMGGLRRLVEQRRLGWLPQVLASCDVLVLQEEEHRRPEEIADLLQLTSESVENILAAPYDGAPQYSDAPPPDALGEREQGSGSLVKGVFGEPHPGA